MKSAAVFPLASPLFDLGKVRLTLRAKRLLASQGVTVSDLLDPVRRLDWSDMNGQEFGDEMEHLRDGEEICVSYYFAGIETAKTISVTCTPGKESLVQTTAEYIHRLQPETHGPTGERPKKTWGKGTFTEPPAEIVKAAGA